MNIEKDLREEFDKRGVNYDQNQYINYVDDSFDSVLDCVENVVNKNCNIQNVKARYLSEEEVQQGADEVLSNTHGVDYSDLENLFERAVKWTTDRLFNAP